MRHFLAPVCGTALHLPCIRLAFLLGDATACLVLWSGWLLAHHLAHGVFRMALAVAHVADDGGSRGCCHTSWAPPQDVAVLCFWSVRGSRQRQAPMAVVCGRPTAGLSDDLKPWGRPDRPAPWLLAGTGVIEGAMSNERIRSSSLASAWVVDARARIPHACGLQAADRFSRARYRPSSHFVVSSRLRYWTHSGVRPGISWYCDTKGGGLLGRRAQTTGTA